MDTQIFYPMENPGSESEISLETLTSSDDDQEDQEHPNSSNNWNEISPTSIINLKSFQCYINESFHSHNLYEDDKILKFYQLFISDSLIETMVESTNSYASENINDNSYVCTNLKEMKNFLGIILWTSIHKFEGLSDIWDENSVDLYFVNRTIITQSMSFERFMSLLKFWNFSLEKSKKTRIKSLLNQFSINFKKYKTPGKYLNITEISDPIYDYKFFKTPTDSSFKRFKSRTKFFKLSDDDGYCYGVNLYLAGEGKIPSVPKMLFEKAVELTEVYLNQGRIFYTNSELTSIDLAKFFLSNNSYLVGTINISSQEIPKCLTQKKLEKNQIFAIENGNGIILVKCRMNHEDKCLLSTNTSSEQNQSIVMEFEEKTKNSNIGNQYKYFPLDLRKALKWDQKFALELILGTSVFNAFLLYQYVSKRPILFKEFRLEIIKSLLNLNEVKPKHQLVKSSQFDHRNRRVSKRCTGCYAKNREKFGSEIASRATVTPRVSTYCNSCQSKPYLCLKCFFSQHNE